MYRGTTPAFSFKLNTDIDFEQIEVLYVTFRSQLCEISFDKNDCTLDNETKTILYSWPPLPHYFTENVTLSLTFKALLGKDNTDFSFFSL